MLAGRCVLCPPHFAPLLLPDALVLSGLTNFRVVGHTETEPKGLPSGSEPRHATKGSGFFQLDIVKRFRNNFGTLRPEQQGKPRALQSRHFHLMIGSACHPCREVLLARRRCHAVNAAFCCLAVLASPVK